MKRVKLEGVGGEIMFQMQFELANTENLYFRQSKNFWEILGLTGGFAIAIIFAGKLTYAIAKSNSSYILTQ